MLFGKTTFAQEYSIYQKYLELFSSLSYLFSESDTPYLQYRIMENIFCEAFNANNLSRTDTAFDATKLINGINYGIGLKTFAANMTRKGVAKTKREKIAEFNTESSSLSALSVQSIIKKVAELRNARINSAKIEYNINETLYHCAIRYHEAGRDYILLKEYAYEPINIDNIICTDKNYKPLSQEQLLELPQDDLYFIEGNDYYSFNRSKSTLFKSFDTSLDNGIIIPVSKIEKPLSSLLDWFLTLTLNQQNNNEINYVILPLYSTRKNKSNIKAVPAKSGLNQWKAKGRNRKFGEMYISIPSLIHKYCKGFFPARSQKFTLITPNNTEIVVSLCQGNGDGKALMSVDNTALSQWFHPLLVKDNIETIVTYEDLSKIGKDSVKIEKISDDKFKFSLATIGSWEEFKNKIEEKNN